MGLKMFGVEFAPLRVPLQRRLQTAIVLTWILSFILLGFGSLFFMIWLLSTSYYWLSLLYWAWYAFDSGVQRRGGRRSERVRRWIGWRYFRDYFPLTLVKTADLDPKRNYIFGCHPHGIFCASFFCHFGTEGGNFSEIFPGIEPHLITLEGQFYFPLYRELVLASGACGCSKESIKHVVEKKGPGAAAMIVIGGAIEIMQALPHAFTINIKRRTGFIKVALESGTPLVPVFSFGENDIYAQVQSNEGSVLRWLQMQVMKVLGFPPPVFHGRGVFQYTFGCVPYRVPVHTVVGAPIDVPRIEHPSREQVLQWHGVYLRALEALFDDHKVKYGVSPDCKLNFI